VDDFGQRLESVFDALVWREQTEGEHDVFPVDAELVLVRVWRGEGHIGDAVGYHVDLLLGHAVEVDQKTPPALGHHDEPGRKIAQVEHHLPLVICGFAKHRV
jgi:hypothetical protein